jgi:hypothetical protein
MMRLIEQIMTWLDGVAQKQGVPLSEVDLDFDEIISGTGPSAFTSAIMADMNERANATLAAAKKGLPGQGGIPDYPLPITWDLFHDMGESLIVSRVLVLTVEAFAAGQGHSDSGNHEARAALVRHHYHASNWPSRHPRYSHPVFGEVEQCNWNDDCVHKWDDDVAAFKKLPDEEQKRVIADHEREEEEKKKAKEEEERKHREEVEQAKRKEEEEKRKKEEEDRRQKEEEQRRKKEDEEKEKEKEKEPEPGKDKDKAPKS